MATSLVFVPTMFASNCGWASESAGYCGRDTGNHSGIGLFNLAGLFGSPLEEAYRLLLLVDAFILIFAVPSLISGAAAVAGGRWRGRVSLLAAGLVGSLGLVNVLGTVMHNWLAASRRITRDFDGSGDSFLYIEAPSSVWLGLSYLLGAVLLVVATRRDRSESSSVAKITSHPTPDTTDVEAERPSSVL
ncbi:hypothetical protein [Planomonospora algeriensis]